MTFSQNQVHSKLIKITSGYYKSEEICLLLNVYSRAKRNYYVCKETKSVKFETENITECFVYNPATNKKITVKHKDIEYV